MACAHILTLRSDGLAIVWICNLHHLIRWQWKMTTDVKHLWLTYWCVFSWCKPNFVWHKQHEIWFKCLHHDQIYCQLPQFSSKRMMWNLHMHRTEFFGSWAIAIDLLNLPLYLRYYQISDPYSMLENVIHVWEN